jgi:hypothetical protein
MKEKNILNKIKGNRKNIIIAISVITAYILFVWLGTTAFYW